MKKQNNKYYFSVEGESEKAYLLWLKEKINNNDNATHKVDFKINIELSPLSMVKSLYNLGETEVFHLCDYESNDEEHVGRFIKILDEMQQGENQGKQVSFTLGYCNYAFDLWILLHKVNLKQHLSDRFKYLNVINKCFHKEFSSMDDYKSHKNFESCLEQLDLDCVKNAINNAKEIMKLNKENYRPVRYRKYEYFKENPSLSVHEIIENILRDCGLL